jgi:hypothetical protein
MSMRRSRLIAARTARRSENQLHKKRRDDFRALLGREAGISSLQPFYTRIAPPDSLLRQVPPR